LSICVSVNSSEILYIIVIIFKVIEGDGGLISDIVDELVYWFAMKKVIGIFIFTDDSLLNFLG